MKVIFVLLLLVALVLFFVYRASIKGKIGEKKVALLLGTLPKLSYRVINNLLIKQNGNSTQIDHVVVSEYGLFVIETKNYKGWIYGGENSEFWTQNIYGKKYELHNPIIQNQGHIHALNRLLKLNLNVYIPIIAFSRKAQLKTSFNCNVVYISQIIRLIRSYNQKRLDQETVELIYDALLKTNVNSRQNRKQHINNVKSNINRRRGAIANGHCPQCGGNLVLRKGKYGKFYGCQNYPNCTYTYQY